MNSGRDPPVFPYERVWEDFSPVRVIEWESLQRQSRQYRRVFSFPDLDHLKFSAASEEAIRKLAERSLGHWPSDSLVSKLYLLAGWHLTDQFQKTLKIDLENQRQVLKRLERSARDFWSVANSVPGEVRVLLTSLHKIEPDTFLGGQQELRISDILCEAYDVALVAARAHADISPKRTGRRPHFRRDTAVRLAAMAIEEEVGAPIRTSRGNSTSPALHFTNAGGVLLRGFLKLLEPLTDEAQIVQSLVRVRKKQETKKNVGSSP